MRFSLEPSEWYGWHLFPGYSDSPFTSVIFIRSLKPAGSRRIELCYRDAGYAAGVQEREEIMRVLSRGEQHLAVRREGDDERIAIIVPVTGAWLRKFASEFARRMEDGERPSTFLDRQFNERSGSA